MYDFCADNLNQCWHVYFLVTELLLPVDNRPLFLFQCVRPMVWGYKVSHPPVHWVSVRLLHGRLLMWKSLPKIINQAEMRFCLFPQLYAVDQHLCYVELISTAELHQNRKCFCMSYIIVFFLLTCSPILSVSSCITHHLKNIWLHCYSSVDINI